MTKKEIAKLRVKKWRENNREKHRAYSLKYQKEHREETNLKNNNWKEKNSEKVSKRRKEIYNDNPLKQKQRTLKYEYGLSVEDYEDMIKKQNGKCAICETETKLCIDHNHINGKVRGLLCRTCNMAIGVLKTDSTIKLLEKAIEYCKDFIDV